MSDKDNPTEMKSESIPVFETVPEEGEDAKNPVQHENVNPEALSEETPEDITQADIEGGGVGGEGPIEIPPDDESDDEGNSKRKYFIIGIGFFIFFIVFIVVIAIVRSMMPKKEVELVYWGLWEPESVYAEVIQAYTKENPHVKIKYSKQDPQRYREKLVAQVNDGKGPDIFRYHNTWLPSIIEITSRLPRDVMSNDAYEKTFYKIAQKDLGKDDYYYGIPLEIDGLILVYNDDLFKKAGIERPPQNWEDLTDVANDLRVLSKEGDVLTSGIALGTAYNIEHFSDILGWMIIQNGGEITDLSSKEAIEAFQKYREFAEPPLSQWDEKMSKDITAFTEGKVAMIIVPSWEILTIKEDNPELKIKTSKLPVLPGKTDPISLANYWVEGVSKSSKNQKEAWKFIAYLSQKDTMEKLYKKQAELRPFGEPYSRVDLRDKLIQNEYIGPVLEQAPFFVSSPTVARTYDNGLNDQINEYLKTAVNSTMKDVDYGAALSTAKEGVSKVLQQYNIIDK